MGLTGHILTSGGFLDGAHWAYTDTDQNVFQPLAVVDSISLAGRGEGKEDRQILSARLASGEKPVASSD